MSKSRPRLNIDNNAWDSGRWTYGLHVLYAIPRENNSDRADSIIVANNFWGRDDAGLQPMLDRVHGSKITNEELRVFYNGML
jgi:hypothetical protein